MFTPKTFLLEGTKRKSLINSGVIKEKDITIADMPKFRKVYLINAMIDIDDDISVSTESIILVKVIFMLCPCFSCFPRTFCSKRRHSNLPLKSLIFFSALSQSDL